jgi:hypothetical protein
MFAYTVRIDVDDDRTLAELRHWLDAGGHVADVLAAGAVGAEVVVLDEVRALECRYRFPSRESFVAYERDHAARLRADGISLLAGRPARFTRTTGEIALSR